jgi:hypothetical protein
VLAVSATGGALLVAALWLLLIRPKRIERIELARYGARDTWLDVTGRLTTRSSTVA